MYCINLVFFGRRSRQAVLLKPCPFNLSMASVIKKWRRHKTALSGYYSCLSHDLLLIPSRVGTHTHTLTFVDEMISKNQACASRKPARLTYKFYKLSHNRHCYIYIHVIYVTWAGVICLIYTHKHEGTQSSRASVDISGKSQLHMLHMLCNTSGIIKIALHYIRKDGTFDYGI